MSISIGPFLVCLSYGDTYKLFDLEGCFFGGSSDNVRLWISFFSGSSRWSLI